MKGGVEQLIIKKVKRRLDSTHSVLIVSFNL